jgi:hypothetical protein
MACGQLWILSFSSRSGYMVQALILFSPSEQRISGQGACVTAGCDALRVRLTWTRTWTSYGYGEIITHLNNQIRPFYHLAPFRPVTFYRSDQLPSSRSDVLCNSLLLDIPGE